MLNSHTYNRPTEFVRKQQTAADRVEAQLGITLDKTQRLQAEALEAMEARKRYNKENYGI